MVPDGDWPGFAIQPADWANPISVEECITEKSLDYFCQNTKARLNREVSSNNLFRVNHQGILVRQVNLDSSQQVAVPKAPRPPWRATDVQYHAASVILAKDVGGCILHSASVFKMRSKQVSAHKNRSKLKPFPPRVPLESVALDILGPPP